MSAPSPEHSSQSQEHTSLTRNTADNRILSYRLNMVQQPEQAKAYASGAKPEDCKPVDPPPILSLLIFELRDGIENNITFSYDGSFFIYASLETAQTAGDGKTNQKENHPTSMHRPYQGIFFFFPELSVLHEGRYQICFNLYETIKDPQNLDGITTERSLFAEPSHPPSSDSPGEVAYWRLKIKSTNFLVYNAKEFPGFSKITALTRTLATESRRVTIRREARLVPNAAVEHFSADCSR
ncbi:hypothetical protein N431DRAFT_493810 [Stipitochalara longipes BDJ]|nr:hypothetical protein N431DRAFT_493810 [Stipitochalara longipes BDJ]